MLSGRAPGRTRSRHRAGFVPPVLNRDVIDEVIAVDDEDALRTARDAARLEARWWASPAAPRSPRRSRSPPAESHGRRIAVVLPDSGERYVSMPFFAP